MPHHIAPDDPRLGWRGAISVESGDGWVMPWRIPVGERELFHPELVLRAAMPAGVRLEFVTDSPWVEVECDEAEERLPADLVVHGEVVASAETDGRTSFRFDGLGDGEKSVELWLPQFGEFRLSGLAVADGASVAAASEVGRTRWVTYGSSITQCRAAGRPTATWPSIVARARGYDLTCLGFGGQCHLDPMVARVIRDRPAELISLCLGINIYGGASMGPRTFGPGILAFVQIIREKHPDTPLALISPIWSNFRENTPNKVAFTLRAMRDEVASAVETLRAHGDANVTYIDGLEVFGAEHADLLPDTLHPNAEGYAVMARNLLRLLPEV